MLKKCIPRIADPQKFRVALAAGERLMNIYKHNREDVKPEPIEITAHRFEVRKKDIYELLRGDKYDKPSKKHKASLDIDEPSTKQLRKKCRNKHVVLSPHYYHHLPSKIKQQQALVLSKENSRIFMNKY